MKAKRIAFALIICVISIFTAAGACADDHEDIIDTDKVIEAVPESAEGVFEDVSLEDSFEPADLINRIIENVRSNLSSIIRSAASSAVVVLGASVLCCVAKDLCPEGAKAGEYITAAGVLAITAATFSGIDSIFGLAHETIVETNAFSKVLLPVLASASAVTGAVTSSAAKYAAAALFLDVLMTAGEKLIIPLIYMYIAASAASAAFGGKLSGVAKLMSKAVKISLTVIAVSFTVYLTVTGLVASSADAATVKVTKTAISTLLPVVGSLVSDAADAVASGVNIIKNSAGVFGVLVTVSVCAIPFLKLSASCIMFKAAGALADTVSESGLSGYIDALSNACGMMLGLAGTFALILFVSVLSVTGAMGAI